ncbi:MAG: hypothetical protein JXA81_08145 [Sedimentisphaerales bacterium]|nr:hypothetical protein [Sedimentisphaerales bacterium]
MAETYIATGRANETMQLFDKMEQMDVPNTDVLNRTTRARISAEWKSLKEKNRYGHKA